MNSYQRREILLQEMNQLESEKINCHACPGFCCSYERNSMQITKVEALDIVHYLKSNNLVTSELRLKLKNTIKKFRLDLNLGNGKKSFVRRSYTCPFYTEKNLGCSLPKDVKPYGCLAYNPTQINESHGTNCASNQDLLLKREEKNENQGFKLSIPEYVLGLIGADQSLL